MKGYVSWVDGGVGGEGGGRGRGLFLNGTATTEIYTLSLHGALPICGALTLNVIAGVGMLGSGVLGAAILGNVQDRQIDQDLLAYDRAHGSALHETYVTQERRSLFGDYVALDSEVVKAAPQSDRDRIAEVEADAKKGALRTVVLFPVLMLVSYLGLILYFRSRGGYRVVDTLE